MSAATSGDRHLALDGVRRYLRAGVPGDVLIEGPPDAYLVVAPTGRGLSIHVRGAPSTTLPDLRAYQHLDADTVHWRHGHWLRLSVRTTHRLEDLYPLLCLVLDGVQLHGRSFATAVSEALDAYREILVQRGILSEAAQVGLIGELLALRHLLSSIGPRAAAAAWLGGEGEEHDFALADVDIEVKTTASTHRRHWISSSAQLEPKPGRPLYLLSFQITRAGSGPGHTLPELVRAARAEAGASESEVSALLDGHGYHDRDADLYPTRWSMRRAPLTFLVDATFPAITTARLVDAIPHASLVTGLTYQLDLETYPATSPPDELGGLVAPEEHPT